MLNRVYVFIFLSPNGWVPCGLLEFEQQGRISTSRFRYGKMYLEREDKIALDPIQLPLRDGTIESPQDFAIFNGIRDAGPDKWGRYLLDKKFRRELSELEYIVATGTDRVGALAFSNLSIGGPRVYTPKGFQIYKEKHLDLALCAGAIEDAIKSEETERLSKYLQYGPSLGGARPKAIVDWNGKAHLAKFSISQDERDEPLIEYATMSLAKKCGLDVPSISKTKVLGKSVFLTERFDRNERGEPIPFISGLTITGLHESDYSKWSYHLIIDGIVKFSDDPSRDLIELFKRMLFNIMVYNNDDHPRNFGFLYSGNNCWRLSPLYDVVPTTIHSESFNLASIVGSMGKQASISNALSRIDRFRITKDEAEHLIKDMSSAISDWRNHFRQVGLSDGQINALEKSFSAKP